MKKRNIVQKIRKGPFSAEEKKHMEDWAAKMDIKDISERLNRSPMQVEKFVKQYIAGAPPLIAKRSETEEFRRELYARSDWPKIKKEFTDKELLYYENDYIDMRRQFRDITPTETKQLHHLITLDIFMHRHNKDRAELQEEAERIQRTLKSLHSVDTTPNQATLNNIASLEATLQANRAAITSRSREYKDLLEKHEKILVTLKATRDQRIKNLDDEGKFIGILKKLEASENRRTISEIMGLTDLSISAETERLSAAHQYADGMVDQPLLNHETLLDEIDEFIKEEKGTK